MVYKGLTGAEVAVRQAAGQTNVTHEKTSRTIGEIFRANVFTRFNALLFVLFIIVLFVGELVDALFFFAIIINSGMGIAQELRAKSVLDKLTILSAPRVRVVRDGESVEIDAEAVVLDDLVEIKVGDQVPTDGEVIATDGVEIDESLLTGEADPVRKNAGDQVLSGSIVVSGSCQYHATAVGDDAYAYKLSTQVKKFTKMHSELMSGTNKLLGYISIVILVVAPVLVWGQIANSGVDIKEAALRSIAAIVGMIPEGLVVLTSFAFVLATMTLARRKVLVQELPAVEGLARVDVICLDKTGTLTEGKIVFDRLEVFDKQDEATVQKVLATFSKNPESPTLTALHDAFPTGAIESVSTVAFSSKRKWSAHNFAEQGGWLMGAPEIVFPDASIEARQLSDQLAADGARVMVLARSKKHIDTDQLPTGLEPVALVVLNEKIRPDARETLQFFVEQGVGLKVISGDNPRTVAAVARKVGIDVDEAYDARNLPEDVNEVAEIIEKHSVFGRVLPEQKRLFVRALQSKGHVVAMTGDGVNDALALKDADIGIAMGNGAPATRAVARLVLLDSKFSHMPHVLAEGRRVIANIERVSNLFVIKNVYNLIFALTVTVLMMSFPFLPRHLSLISWLTIGIPAFFLALAPNNRRYVSGFLMRVLQFAIPVGAVIATTAILSYGYALQADTSAKVASSAAVISVVTIGLWVLVCLARPLKAWKVGLIATMGAIFVGVLLWPWFADILEFQAVAPYSIVAFVLGIAGSLVVELIWRFGQKRSQNIVDGR